MNGKKARNLRKLIEKNIPDLPKVEYAEKNQREKLFPGGLNSDGTPRYTPLIVSTRVLENCQRQVYQKAKTIHHAYHGR